MLKCCDLGPEIKEQFMRRYCPKSLDPFITCESLHTAFDGSNKELFFGVNLLSLVQIDKNVIPSGSRSQAPWLVRERVNNHQ